MSDYKPTSENVKAELNCLIGTEMLHKPKSLKTATLNTFLIGSEEINVMTALRSFGKTNWPLGLLISEQTCEKEQRSYDSEIRIFILIQKVRIAGPWVPWL